MICNGLPGGSSHLFKQLEPRVFEFAQIQRPARKRTCLHYSPVMRGDGNRAAYLPPAPWSLLFLLREPDIHGLHQGPPDDSPWGTLAGEEGEKRVREGWGIHAPSFLLYGSLQAGCIPASVRHSLLVQVLVATPSLFRSRAGVRPSITSLSVPTLSPAFSPPLYGVYLLSLFKWSDLCISSIFCLDSSYYNLVKGSSWSLHKKWKEGHH